MFINVCVYYIIMKNVLENFRKRKKQDRLKGQVNVYLLKTLREWARKEKLNLSLILEERLKELAGKKRS